MTQGATTTTTMTASSGGAHPHHGAHPPRGGAGPVSRLVRFAGRTVKTSLAVVGVAALAAGYYEYRTLFPPQDDDENYDPFGQKKVRDESSNGNKKEGKKVLVVPFHRIHLVERKKRDEFGSLLNSLGQDKEDRLLEMELRELVDVLHEAASDPEIGALYGIFGPSSGGEPFLGRDAGWADLEEVRNALRVFRESHRRHSEPNFSHQVQVIPRIQSKPLYAYTDTFAGMNPGNREYYLASMFTHIHMQKHGELNLFGLISPQFFLRGFLEKYGINLHVFKHGSYKNAPNAFTEYGFNRPHQEQVTALLEQVDADIFQDIVASRSKALLTSWLKKNKSNRNGADTHLWKRIHESGTFPALTAWKSGLVDYLPRRDPLPDLLDSNASDAAKEEMKSSWEHQETDFGRFHASKAVNLMSYTNSLRKKKKAAKRREQWHALFHQLGGFLSVVGYKPTSLEPRKKKEEIALLHVNGIISGSTARKLVHSIRKIRKNDATKCVVVRVSSSGGSAVACETIAQELNALKVPVVFSFGNTSASGGYYIAAAADRIFASKKTITGSIGVFGIRADLTGLAEQYRINVEHVATGKLAGLYSPFVPMTRVMKENMSSSIDRSYERFKTLVSEGRSMSLEEVDAVAQGRVFTGDQAKTNGLVDEIGGLCRAIVYAQRNYTKGEADVVSWPKQVSLLQRLVEAGEQGNATELALVAREWMTGTQTNVEGDYVAMTSSLQGGADLCQSLLLGRSGLPSSMSGVFLAADEDTAIRTLLESAASESNEVFPLLPSSFWD